MSTHGRNDPCHCGSGKKYKHCHLEADRRVSAAGRNETDMDAAITAQDAAAAAASGPLKIGLAVVGLLVAGAVAFFKDMGSGLIVLAAWALASMAYLTFRNPPPPNENPGDPAGLNFGNTTEKR